MSCRTTHPGPSAAALFDAVSLGPAWGTRRHFGSLNGHGPSRHPGTPRRHCKRCRVSCKIQERRSSDVRATNTATLRHAEASTSSTAETSTKKSRRSRLSGRQAFLAAAMGLHSDASQSRCHSTTPTATPARLEIPAQIAPQSPYTTAAVQASCERRVIGVLLSCCCVQQAGSPSNCRCARVARNRGAARSHGPTTTSNTTANGPTDASQTTRRPKHTSHKQSRNASAATSPTTTPACEKQPASPAHPARHCSTQCTGSTVQRSAREHVERPRRPRAHRARTRHRLVGHRAPAMKRPRWRIPRGGVCCLRRERVRARDVSCSEIPGACAEGIAAGRA